MTIKKKSLITILLSFACALIVVFGCLFAVSQPAYADDEEEYVWVDLQVGDVIGGKKLRFESSIVYSPKITITFDNDYGIQHSGIDPLMVILPGEDTSSETFVCEWSYQEEVSDENGVSWWKTEYNIPETFAFVTYGPNVDENGLAILPEEYDHSLDFLTMKVANIEMADLNNDYGVKIQMLMDKDEAIASGRIEGDINTGRSLFSVILPLIMVCGVACLCLCLTKNKKKFAR